MSNIVKSVAVRSSMSKADMEKMAKSILMRGTKLRVEMHNLVVGWAMHYVDCGDYTMLPRITDVIQKVWGHGMVKALNDWIKLSVNGLVWNDDLKAWEHVKGSSRSITPEIVVKDRKGKITFSGNPLDILFFDLEIPKDPKPFDLEDSFASLLKRAEKAYEQQIKDGTIDPDFHARIEVLKSINLSSIHSVPANDDNGEKIIEGELIKAETVKRRRRG